MHIPRIRPSLNKNSFTASLIFGFLKTLEINFPEPSGSSPALNPPGIIIIFEFLILLAISSVDSLIRQEFKFLNINVSAFPPSFSKALAQSYSQFVPGNTGIKTLGLAFFIVENFFILKSENTFFIFRFTISVFVLKTSSKVFEYAL